jgi:hypothetical protein
MDIKLLLVFVGLNIVNVILQTVKSIATVKCGKSVAALVNAIAFGLYTIVTVYTLCDLPLLLKAAIVAVCNLVGVYVVKLLEEKARKDKLWKIEMAIPNCQDIATVSRLIDDCGISFYKVEVDNWVVFNCYCKTQLATRAMVELAKDFNGKISAYESQTL